VEGALFARVDSASFWQLDKGAIVVHLEKKEDAEWPTLVIGGVGAADKMDPQAMYICGELHEKGVLGSVDQAKALAYFRRSADAKFVPSLLKMAQIFAFGHQPKYEEPDVERMLAYVEEAAALGSMDAYLMLANFHQSDIGRPIDMNEAVHWLRKAATHESQHPLWADAKWSATWQLGAALQALQCDTEAIEWLTKASARVPQAAAQLGLAYLEGRGVPRDQKRAAELFEHAKRLGIAPEDLPRVPAVGAASETESSQSMRSQCLQGAGQGAVVVAIALVAGLWFRRR